MKHFILIFLLSIQLDVGPAFADSYTIPTITNTAPQTISPDLLTSQQTALKADLAATNADSTAMLFWMTTAMGCAAACGTYYLNVKEDLAQVQAAMTASKPAITEAPACVAAAPAAAQANAQQAVTFPLVDDAVTTVSELPPPGGASTTVTNPIGLQGPSAASIEASEASVDATITAIELAASTAQGAAAATGVLPAVAATCQQVSTSVAATVSPLTTANAKLKADSSAVRILGTACQAIMLGAGINDIIAAQKVGTQTAKSDGMISAVGAVGVSFLSGGMSAAYNIITSNAAKNPTQLTASAGKASCWSAAFATAEIIFHSKDASKEQDAANQLKAIINSEQGANGAVSTTSYKPKPQSQSRIAQFFGFFKKLWGVSERSAVAAASPPTPPWVNQCTGPFATTQSALSCAGAKDPVIQAVLSKPENPFGALTTYMDQNLGANTSNILSGKASLDELARIASYKFPSKKQAILDGLSNMSFEGQTLGKSYAAILTGKATAPTLLGGVNSISNSSGAAVSASKPTLGVSTLTFSGSGSGSGSDTTAVSGVDQSSNSDPNSKMTTTGLATRDPAAAENPNLNIFDRVTARYQNVQDRLDPTKQALKDWGTPPAQTANN